MLALTTGALGFSAPAAMRPAAAARSSALAMGVADLPGISTETGGVVWDPLGLSAKMDAGNLNLMRAAELKHGRVAMLATVGWAWMATGSHFEGMISTKSGISFADVSAAATGDGNPLTAAALVPGGGMWQIILACGVLEVAWENKYPATECAGNFGVPAVTNDPEKLAELQLMELKNGRLAMIGIISFACAVAVPGSVPLYPF